MSALSDSSLLDGMECGCFFCNSKKPHPERTSHQSWALLYTSPEGKAWEYCLLCGHRREKGKGDDPL